MEQAAWTWVKGQLQPTGLHADNATGSEKDPAA